jgi:hypothetical protein
MRAHVMVGLVGTIVFGACGDDGEAEGRVASDKRVDQLSASENERLCRAIAAQWKRVELATFEAGCISEVLGTESCEADRKRCVERATDAETARRCDDTPEQITGGDACEAKVGELESCFQALGDASRAFADTITCDKRVEQIVPLAPPKACTDIAPRCQPAIFFTGS